MYFIKESMVQQGSWNTSTVDNSNILHFFSAHDFRLKYIWLNELLSLKHQSDKSIIKGSLELFWFYGLIKKYVVLDKFLQMY